MAHLGQGAVDQEEALRTLLLAEKRRSLIASHYLPRVRERLMPDIVHRIETETSPTLH